MESVFMLRMLHITVLIVLSSIIFFGCFQATEEKGVLNQWRDNALPPLEKGKTTETPAIPAYSLVTSSSHVNNMICSGVEQLFCLDACRIVSRRGAMGG